MFTQRFPSALVAVAIWSASAAHAAGAPTSDPPPTSPFPSFHSELDLTPPLDAVGSFALAVLDDTMTEPAHAHGGRADAHAPIGVMADHTHRAGEVMLSYRYMYMDMSGNRGGDRRLSTADVLADFPVTPTDMSMQMHMVGAMYAPTDWVTLMAMVPYVINEMDHVTRMGGRFTTKSEGIGDVRLTAMFPIVHEGPHALRLNFGLSLPTGSIDEKDATPADPGATRRLPYPMQLGSGTFDLLPGASYTYLHPQWSFGVAANGTIRLDENDNDYTLGNRFDFTTWWAYKWQDRISTSVRLNYQAWGNIDGADPDLNRMMVPTADPNRRGGQRLDLLFGINLYDPDGPLAGHRLAVEIGFPIYQYLEGPQLETDLIVTVGWQYAF